MLEAGARVEKTERSGILRVNEEFDVSLVLSRCRQTIAGRNRWVIRFDNALHPDITVAVRMEQDAESIRDYYLLPAFGVCMDCVRLGDFNDFGFDAYRYSDLGVLCHLAKRVPLKGVRYE
ncbi:serine recombinase [Pandoraea anhela]|uniref:Serine recombinase n=1 Tax=Pandoraea anhela TaxID=2508295 RepID=A0A5E4Z9Y5_9BURK|nr:serine recombinase [Pandoraea anhela]